MKKNTIYIALAAIAGLLIGYVIFGVLVTDSNSSEKHNHTEDAEQSQMWTCSMHPQIMQPEPGDCPICGMDLIPAEIFETSVEAGQFKMTKNAMELANIQTTIVGDQHVDPKNTITLSGKIKENREANAVQASYFDGRIERLNVNYAGQEVQKGQLLATIYSPTLVAAQQELLTTLSLKATQPELYKAVRNKLKLWKLSENQINDIESSSKVQENFPIYATVSGTVSEVLSAEGDYVKQGQALLKVSDLSSVWAEFDAYEDQLSLFSLGQKIRVRTKTHPGNKIDAVISFIDPVLNTRTRIATIRATLNNKKGLLKPGMFVTGKIEGIYNNAQQLRVPTTAVMWTGERSVVYVKTDPDEPVFEMREVLIGTTNENTVTILQGLVPGDEIVTNGTFTVDAAAQLQGKKSMMNKEGSKIMTGHEDHINQ